MLALLGGFLGLGVALVGRRWLPLPDVEILNWEVFAFVALLSCATGVGFSLAPAWWRRATTRRVP